MITRLERERRERDWSQAQVAEYVGAKSRTTVSRWERGNRRPSRTTEKRLEQLFGLTIGELLPPRPPRRRVRPVAS